MSTTVPTEPGAVRRPQHGAAVWRTADVLADTSWRIQLDDRCRTAIADAARRAASAGVTVESMTADAFPMPGLEADVAAWSDMLQEGRGFLLSPRVVRAVLKDGTAQDLATDKMLIATGSRPARLPGIAVDGERVLTSDDAVQLKRAGSAAAEPRTIEIARLISPYGWRFDSTWSFTWHVDNTDFSFLLHY